MPSVQVGGRRVVTGHHRAAAPTYSCLFPAVLTYKLSSDQKVVAQLRSRSLGNSATRLYNIFFSSFFTHPAFSFHVLQLHTWSELGPGKLARHQPPGGGHLQPAVSASSRGHACQGDHEDPVVPHPRGLRVRAGDGAGKPEADGSDHHPAL
ncbi:hypothetical protein ATANTOWER_026444 [Ataeniobius toweri]|uniref:DUF6729 domain-containing protein n=1 Tax=Ataeniobius toweri TaxID=208326 RepID=A0ABU7ATF2_9TELE|nr:hypothetical protein [Ataeniobius toweri]